MYLKNKKAKIIQKLWHRYKTIKTIALKFKPS